MAIRLTIALTNEATATQTNKFMTDYYDEITHTEDSIKDTDIPVFGHNVDTSKILNYSNTPSIHIAESTADFPVDTQIQHEEIQNSNIDLSSGLNDDTEEFTENFASNLNPSDENAFLQTNDDSFPHNLQFTNPSFHTAVNMFLGDEATDVHSMSNPDQVTHARVSDNNSHQPDDQVVSDTPMIERSINFSITEYSPIEPPAVLDLSGFQGLTARMAICLDQLLMLDQPMTTTLLLSLKLGIHLHSRLYRLTHTLMQWIFRKVFKLVLH